MHRGQRLVLNFTQDGQSIATLYQHWSGYTLNAFATLQEISEYGETLGLFKEQGRIEKIKSLAETLTNLYFDDIAYANDEAPFWRNIYSTLLKLDCENQSLIGVVMAL